MKNITTLLFLVALLPFGSAGAVVMDPTTLNFRCITFNDPASCALGEAQLSVQLQSGGTDSSGNDLGTFFTFFNTDSGTPENPRVHEIYFDFTPAEGVTETFVNNNVMITDWSWQPDPLGWVVGITPPTLAPPGLSGGNSIGFDADFGADSGNSSDEGIFDEGESLTILVKAFEYDRILSALNGTSGEDFAIGLHVGSLVGGESESFVTTVSPVPLPASVWLFGSALLGFIGFSRRTSV